MATALDPAHARGLADSLFAGHEADLNADHERWKAEFERPDPKTTHTDLTDFIGARPAYLLQYLAQRTGLKLRVVSLEVPEPHLGELLIDGLALSPGLHEITCFQGVRIPLEFRATPGVELSGWKGAAVEDSGVWLDPDRARVVKPLFAVKGS